MRRQAWQRNQFSIFSKYSLRIPLSLSNCKYVPSTVLVNSGSNVLWSKIFVITQGRGVGGDLYTNCSYQVLDQLWRTWREREETYLKLFYNRHPGLGAIGPGWRHSVSLWPLIVFWKQSMTGVLMSHLRAPLSPPRDYSRKCSVLRIETVFSNNQAGDNPLARESVDTCRKYCTLMMLATFIQLVWSSSWQDLQPLESFEKLCLQHFLELKLKVIWTRIIVGGWEWLCNDASGWTKTRAVNLLRGWLEKCSIKFSP